MRDRRRSSRIARWWLALTAALCLSACAITPPQPQTADQALYEAYSLYAVAHDTLADATTAGDIAPAQAEQVRGHLMTIRTHLDALRDAMSGDNPPSVAAIQATRSVLLEIIQTLEARDGSS